ncbi:hypothetical protein [Streptomyces sp. NPDC048442]|uniref:hypothetical protein n=1 Tax=Streptomyces sp. NPDC048442 TaxID=3154823 RepID=UPI00341B979F
MSSEQAASALRREADSSTNASSQQLRGGAARPDPKTVIARTGVLSGRVLAFDIHRAVIRLWTTAVRGNTVGGRVPTTGFSSDTVNLVWESGDWKISAFSTGKGHVAPVSTDQATNVAADFADYVPARADDPVASGSTDGAGLPGPYRRDVRGARSAAVNSVLLHGDPRFFTDSAWRHTVLNSTSAPSALPDMKRDADSTAGLVAENRGVGTDGKSADGGTLVTRTGVLATRTRTYSDQAASVELWTASVGGVAGDDETLRPQVAFLRMSVDLIWSGGTWKALSVSPSEPLVPSQSPTEQATPAPQFSDVGGVADAAAFA